MKQIKTISGAWLGKQIEVWRPEVFKNIKEFAPDAFDTELLDDLREIRQQMVAIVKEATGNITRVDKAIEHAQKCIAATKVQASQLGPEDVRPVGHRQQRIIDLTTNDNGAPNRKTRRPLQNA